MLGVIIADDNEMIRKGIVKRINWTKLGLKVIAETSNGLETFEKIKELKPDIVITDIKMPKEDGFYTIENCQEEFQQIQFIIISGYDDFEYMKKAIQYDVRNYVLKPISTEELESTLIKCKNRLEKYNKMAMEKEKADQWEKQYLRQKIESRFFKFLIGKIDYVELMSELTNLNVSFDNPYVVCFCINICNKYSRKAMKITSQDLEEIEKDIENTCVYSSCRMIAIYKNTYIGILTLRDNNPIPFQRILDQIKSKVEEDQEARKVFLSFGNTLAFNELELSYDQCKQQMLKRFTKQGNESRIFYPDSPEDEIIKLPQSLYLEVRKNLIIAFELELYDECKQIIDDILEYISRYSHYFSRYIVEIFRILNRFSGDILELSEFNNINSDFYAMQFYDISEIRKIIYNIIDKMPADLNQESLILRVLKYIQYNYTKPIKLYELGELFHINHVYLGQLISKEVGMNFNQYINQLRINHAVNIIQQNPQVLLKDLADAVGYSDPHYFSKVFKDYTGNTPSQYRVEYE